MLSKLKMWLTPPQFEDATQNRQSQIGYPVFLLALSFNLFALLADVFFSFSMGRTPQFSNIIFPLGFIVIIFVLLATTRQGYTIVSSAALVGLFLAQTLIALALLQGGTNSPFMILFFIPLLLGGFLFNIWVALGVTSIFGITLGVFAYLETSGQFTPPAESVSLAVLYTPVFLFLLFVIHLMLRNLNSTLNSLHRREEDLQAANAQLQAVQSSLEQRVAERTRNLEAVAALGEQLAQLQDLNHVQQELVHGLQTAFGYHQVQMYRYQAEEQQLRLTAITQRDMLELAQLNYTLSLEDMANPVVRAVTLLEVVHETQELWFDEEFLSQAKAQMAVPIILDDDVVGALNVYAKDTNQLGDNDANQLRLVANQVAGILRNARTLAEKEQSLAALQAIQNRYLAQNWEQYRRSTRTLQVQAQQEGEALAINQPLSNSLEHAKQAALKQGHTFSLNPLPLQNTLPQADTDTPAPAPKQPEAVLVTPLMLGDQVLGTLGIRDKGSAQAWSENDVAFVEAVAQQVAQALENARLFNETQLRASRERLTREITDKMRQAPDLDSIVNIGLRELGQVLGVSRSYVKLTVQNSSDVSGAEAAEASPPNTQVAERE